MRNDATDTDGLDPAGSCASAPAVREPLLTFPLAGSHKVSEFRCKQSPRVEGFFQNEAPILVPQNYCRVFILPQPDDPTVVWGYYTLSAALLEKDKLSNSDEKRASRNILGIPVPMVRIGFMGKCDGSPNGLGAILLSDAARRVYRNSDIAAWGLVLEAEGGPANPKLWAWYQAQGFRPCRKLEHQNSMYAALSKFMPELTS